MTPEPNSLDQFLQSFRETIRSAAARLRSISHEQSGRAPAAEKWTPREILGHLIDSAANNHQRFVRAQLADELVFSSYEQNRWVSVQRYNDESWLDLIQLWTSYNLHLLHLMSVIPESVLTQSRASHNLDQIGWAPMDRPEAPTLEYFIRDYVDHLRRHLDQIFTAQPSELIS